ncbi:hypothetical protein PL321_07275 [Caloramator sp. mosi_1]|uniref:hypothetical protein n=1 Tax=Caloramator sp. mosi_1 TaxID=3023090 RepID=UPI00235DEC8A|nr:hypothetical protein [Caloramator sp. mosi_1]WDC85247.1 hypothetical protein PL321_07275 [Caloramator sp. mosi_1]
MKRYFTFIILILFLIFPANRLIKYKKHIDSIYKDGKIKYISKVDEKYFYIYQDKKFKKHL